MHLVVVHELRHFPAVVDRQQAQREAAAEAAQDRGRVGHAPVQQQQVHRTGQQRNDRVQLLLEDQRHLVAEDVAQHTAEGTGQHARDQHDGR
ncbi:hypothetical protein G6F64_015128 [Rhizopus arrhizus]|uniref:Uncharacterized protein n=1 Tax=Rhizopus oryzae TaxID=64495 RepID=A0A9P6WSP4_RHIOR|nr:hypothetical protein G6F24_018286 [Rhizopus arrhizus]KAG0911476.1 hypothetical protein G6F32_016763 [Rhizopus arrhizus]KAG1274456.1 hypothetical protein G6F64_015128 [Rhizopus arrhizus]KAG1390808.1 hypothetical protein G6F58_012884 [Rhizopus delemar]